MALRPKTSRRLLLLAVVALLVLCAGAGLLFVRKWQRERRSITARADGIAMVEQGKYYQAMTPLSRYLKGTRDDREALLAYAKARENVEEPTGSHLTEAIRVYQQAYAADRSDRATAIRILEMCVASGMYGDAISLADELRPEDLSKATKDDLVVLRSEGAARQASQPREDATGAVLQRILELDTDDFGARVLYVQWAHDSTRLDRAQIVAKEFKDRFPNDPRGRLLDSVARSTERGFDTQREMFMALCAMNGLDPVSAGPTGPVQYKDALEVLRSVRLFDSVNAYAHSLAVLMEGAKQTKDPIVERMQARRLWMVGRSADALRVTEGMDPADKNVHTEMLLFRGLAFLEESTSNPQYKAEAARFLGAATSREGDYRSTAWKPVVQEVLLSESPVTAEKRLDIFNEAVKRAPTEPALAMYQADTLERLGRNSEARDTWRRTGEMAMAVGWSRPWLNIAYSYLAEGRPRAALDAAQVAARIAPRSMGAYECLLRTNVSLILGGFEAQMSAPPPDLLSSLEKVDRELALSSTPEVMRFRLQTLPGRILLTSRVHGKDKAKAMLAETLKTLDNPPVTTLQELLDVNAREELGSSDQLTAMLGQRATTPQAVYALAMTRHRAGDTDGGRAMLQQRLESADTPQKPEWRLALANFMDAITTDRAAAGTMWVSVADEYSQNLNIQMAALSSPTIATNREAVDRIAQRAIQIGGFETGRLPPIVRLARARTLLSEPVTEFSRNQAIELLRGLLTSEPDLLEARTLLITGLVMDRPEANIRPLTKEASEQILALIPLVPNPAALNVELAKLQILRGELPSAKAQLEAVTNNEKAPLDIKLAAADLLVQQRELSSAAAALERIEVRDRSSIDVQSRLASVYRALARDREALAILRELGTRTYTQPDQALAVASDLAAYRENDAAQRVLSQLSSMKLQPGVEEEYRARFVARYGTPEEAIALLRSSIQKRPKDVSAWSNLISFFAERGQLDRSREALEEAKQAIGADPRLAAIEQKVALASTSAQGTLDLAAIAALLDKDPQTKARAAAIREIDAARTSGSLAKPEEVERLAQRHSGDPVALTTLAQLLASASPPNFDSAMEIMRRTVREHPRSAEAAVYATQLFRERQRWTDMFTSAKAWQELTRDPNADLALGESLLALDRRDAAAEAVKRHVDGALKTPEQDFSSGILALTARSLVAANRASDAQTLLQPLLATSPRTRRQVWCLLAGSALQSEEVASRWMEIVAPIAAADSIDDQLAIAGAHMTLSRRFSAASAKHLSKALSGIQPLAKTGAPAGVFEALGTVQAARGERDQAITAYRTAITTNDKSFAAMRGLANLLISTDTAEASRLADQAVSIIGTADLETQEIAGRAYFAHAQALSKAGKAVEAKAQFTKAASAFGVIVTVQPGNAMAHFMTISALDNAGQTAQTLPYFEKLLDIQQLPQGATRAVVQNNYADAIVRSKPTQEQLQRARSLALQASQAQPQAPMLDTLGAVHAALKERTEAIAAYRRAVQADPSFWHAWAGLAGVLAEGSATEKSEARTILDRLDKTQALPEDTRAKAAAVRELLK
jgi:tetratricopeptide (TPR) repeat protein